MTFPALRPVVYLITAGSCSSREFGEASSRLLNIIEMAVNAGVDLVQIREKQLTGKHLYELSGRAFEITRRSPTKLLINDRFDIALAVGADGVHLTSSSLSAAVVRQCTPPDFVIGVSVHSLAEAQVAADDGADFALFGPVFASPGKGEGAGLNSLQSVCAEMSGFPMVAIGGIDATNWPLVIDAGAAGFGAIRSLHDPDLLREIMIEVRG